MAIPGLEVSAKDVVTILQVGAPGLAFLLALLAFLLYRKAPEIPNSNALQAYKVRSRGIAYLLIANVAIFGIACALQYILTVKETRVYIVIQEGSQFSRLSLQPIELRHRSDTPISIPGEKMTDRALLTLRDEDQLDLSVRPLLERITDLHVQLNAHTASAAARSRQGGFDDPR
jgi:hypothetical protein